MNNLSTPAIWFPGQSSEEFDEEIKLMMLRSQATNDFLQGRIAVDSFLDFIDDAGFDVFDLATNCWNLTI